MRCSSDVLKKTSPLDIFGDVSEKVKHLTNDAANDVSPPALPPEPAAIFQGGSEPAKTLILQQVLDCDKTPQI